MNHTDEEISLEFYHYLCNIVGSDDVVKKRRGLFTIMDYVHNDNGMLTFISSGSKAEGLDLKGSDFDIMLVFDQLQVYEDNNNVINGHLLRLILMETNDTKPGFTKLKVDPFLKKKPLWRTTLDTLGEETFISSKRFRELFLASDLIIHGPCISDPDETFDNAFCLRCKEWITSAQPWINRPRSTWPDYKLVTSIVQYGVLFVPIGSKYSPHEHLEWRISFSMAEKQLIYSFSHTQLLCYSLLKIILKDIIKPKHGDIICSYFLKTIMFWLSEESCPSDWKPKSFLSCFLKCLRRLIYCVEYRTCLHYFIPDNNLFENRFTDDQQVALLDTLQFIHMSPWTVIFKTSMFQEYRLDSRNSHGFELTVSVLPCLCLSLYSSDFFPIYDLNAALNRVITCCINFPDQELSKYVMSLVSNPYTQAHHPRNLTISNKSFYRQNHIMFGSVKLGLSSDVLNSWILFASSLYQCKRLKECIYMINYCLSKCTPDKIACSYLIARYSLEEQTVFNRMRQRVGLIATCKNLIIQDVVFYFPFILLPIELTRLPKVMNRMYIPSVVYCHVLLFLCFHHLRDNRGKLTAIRDIELTIRERYFISHDKKALDTVNQCLDIVKALV